MSAQQRVFIVDDDAQVRAALCILLQSAAYEVLSCGSAEEFLAEDMSRGGCAIVDVRMPGISGLELQEKIACGGRDLPVIVVTGHGDVTLAVRAMKAGAVDFIEKPFDGETLLNSVERAVKMGQQWRDRAEERKAANRILATLTARERDVLACLVRGRPNKVAAFELGISPRTVEIHRARIMSKMKAKSLSDLVRVVLASDQPMAQARPNPVPAAASPAPPQ